LILAKNITLCQARAGEEACFFARKEVEDMSSTRTWEKLFREKPVSHEEWVSLVRERAQRLKPHLDRFTLNELGNVYCINGERLQEDTLTRDNPTVMSKEGHTLKTRGIFGIQPHDSIQTFPGTGFQPWPGGRRVPDGQKKLWGLIRTGSWVVVTITFIGVPGYKDRGREQAMQVTIEETALESLIEKTSVPPREIWDGLGEAVQNWKAHREQLAHVAAHLAEQINIEDRLLNTFLALNP
jgi:hypothetical protein